MWSIFNEDAIKWAKEYSGEKFHALLTDAPYHLTSIVKRFGKNGSAPAKFGNDGVFQRSSKGFMGTQWDGGDIAFRPETWEAFKEVLYPGAFGMAFSASRNWHRMAVAIEDAGFIIHPTMFFLWIQGQGFPKATKIRDERFSGHKYGLQALKPAVEPIIVFQKPYEGRPIDNILGTGAGALNIDGGRIPTDREVTVNRFTNGAKPWGNARGEEFETEKTLQGRYPSNLVLDENSAEILDFQSGFLKSGKMTPDHTRHTDSSPHGIYGKFDVDAPLNETIGDEGGASRFFYTVSNQLDESEPFLYQSKVSPKERNAGLDGFETRKGSPDYRPNDDGSSGIQSRLHGATMKGRNHHPTVKPINLAKHLAALLLPPVDYAPRRIFIPFSGVASEMIGACMAGWERVVGVEFDTENDYVDIAKKRLDHWLK